MPFVRFTEVGRSHTPRVSISQSGLIGLSKGARTRFSVDNSTHCVLYYDDQAKRIGIELTNDSAAEGAQKIRLGRTGVDVSGRSFLSFFGIEVNETTLYPICRDADTGYLIIDLSKGRPRGKGQAKGL